MLKNVLGFIKANSKKILVVGGTMVGLAIVGNMVTKKDEETEVVAEETAEQVETEVTE